MDSENVFSTKLEKIRENGYWKIVFHPEFFKEDLIQYNQLVEMIEKSSITLRTWPFPFMTKEGDDSANTYLSNTKIESWVDFDHHLEVLRFHQSGKFVFFRSLVEDVCFKSNWLKDIQSPLVAIEPRTIIDPIWAIHQVNEIYAFFNSLGKLLSINRYYIEIDLNNIYKRKLELTDKSRIGLSSEYRCSISDIKLVSKTITQAMLLESYKEEANETLKKLFSHFKWEVNTTLLEDEQRKFFERII